MSALVSPSSYLPTLKERARAEAVELLTRIGSMEGLTEPQKEALILAQTIDILNVAEFYVEMAMGEVFNEIEAKQLAGMHPSDMYHDIDDIAGEFGISPSEVSDLRILSGTVVPYLASIGIDPVEAWRRIGKAKFRSILPILRIAITGKGDMRPGVSQRVQKQLEEVRKDITLAYEQMGKPLPEDMSRATVEYLIDIASDFSWSDLQRIIHKHEGEPVCFIYDDIGNSMFKLESTIHKAEHVDTVRKKMGAFAEIIINRGAIDAQSDCEDDPDDDGEQVGKVRWRSLS